MTHFVLFGLCILAILGSFSRVFMFYQFFKILPLERYFIVPFEVSGGVLKIQNEKLKKCSKIKGKITLSEELKKCEKGTIYLPATFKACLFQKSEIIIKDYFLAEIMQVSEKSIDYSYIKEAERFIIKKGELYLSQDEDFPIKKIEKNDRFSMEKDAFSNYFLENGTGRFFFFKKKNELNIMPHNPMI